MAIDNGVVLRPYEGTQTTFYVDTKKSQFADWTYDDYVGDMLDQLQRVRNNATFGDTYNLEIHGHPFTVIDYEEEGDDGETYYYRSYFTAHGYGYIVYYVI
jgi:hypothetical protein